MVAVVVICQSRRVEFELLGTDSLNRATLMAGRGIFLGIVGLGAVASHVVTGKGVLSRRSDRITKI